MRPLRLAPAILTSLALLAGTVHAGTIDLTSGTSGTTFIFQSFNETRGAAVTILSATDLSLTAMELRSFNVAEAPNASLTARVYDDVTHSLLASGAVPVPEGDGQSVSVPIATTLVSGRAYRICFFLSADNTGSCTQIDPGALGPPGLPYTEGSGKVRIDGIWQEPTDAFPTHANNGLPLISLVIAPGCVDLTIGPTGMYSNQSFNETRGMDVTVQGTTDLDLVAMTLHGLQVDEPGGSVGARVYDSATHARIAAADVTVTSGANQSVTTPMGLVLQAGKTYRVCFFVDAGGVGGAGILFDPTPAGTGGFPYTEGSGNLRVLQAYSVGSDDFPGGANFFAPHITLCLQTGLVGVRPGGVGSAGWVVDAVRPNPVLGSGALDFSLPTRSRVVLQQFTVTGQRVSRTERILDAGRHAMPVATRGLSDGIYFLEFDAFAPSGERYFSASRKVAILAR